MKDKTRIKLLIGAVGLILIFAVIPVMTYATVPGTINYQGYLADSTSGDPIDTGGTPLSITFNIYTVPTGGTAFWSETLSVTVIKGVYNVILGKTDSLLDEDLTPPCYLGVKVGSDPEMTPRQELTSAAYSISAEDADKLDGLDSTEFVTTESDPTVTASVKDGVSWSELSDIPAGFADGVDNGITSESDPQVGSNTINYVPKWNGSSLSTGSIYDDGNIGIGKTPSYKLDVNGDINTGGVYKIGGTTALEITTNNMFAGWNAGNPGSGINNTFIGNGSGGSNTGNYNTFIGTGAGLYTTGGQNTLVGNWTGQFLTTGIRNTFVGEAAGISGSSPGLTGSDNTFIGEGAGRYSQSGYGNTFIGQDAGRNNTTTSYNTYIGTDAGYNQTGSSNVFVGYQAGNNESSGSNNIFLGYQAGYSEVGSNKLYIDNSSTSSPLIWGDFSSNTLAINGDLGIGTTSPQQNFHVNGLSRFDFGSGRLEMSTPGGWPGMIMYSPDGHRKDIVFRNGALNIAVGTSSSPPANTDGIWILEGGNTGIGTTNPSTKLNLVGGVDASLSSHGFLVIGSITGPNIVMDENEIICRNNGGTRDLYIQTDSGNVAIGSGAPTQKLDVSGNARFRSISSIIAGTAYLLRATDGTLTTSTSDRRLKTNIANIEDGLEIVKRLQGVRFNWKEDPEVGRRIGLIAQDAEKVIPELTFTNHVDGYMGINYPEITAVLIEAIKDQQKIIDVQQEAINDLFLRFDELEGSKKAETESLKNQLSHLRKMVERIMARQTDSKDNKDLLSMSR